MRKVLPNPKWRERITSSGPCPSPRWGDGQGQASFGYAPLACPRCGTIMQLAEVWEPKRGHVWMRRWLETHRAIKALRAAFSDLRTRPLGHFRQLGFNFSNTS